MSTVVYVDPASGTEVCREDVPDEILEAARLGDHDEYLSILLNACPEAINHRDEHGATPLHYAVANGNLSTVSILLSRPPPHNAILNAANKMGSQPLHWAVMNGHPACVEALLRAGAPVDSLNTESSSAIDFITDCTDDLAAAAIEKLILQYAPADPLGDGEDCEDGPDAGDAAGPAVDPDLQSGEFTMSVVPEGVHVVSEDASPTSAAVPASSTTAADAPVGMSTDLEL